jgi:small subunit ribosomal protein S3
VCLHRDLTDIEFTADLFIQQTGDDPFHDLAFTPRECCITIAHCLQLCLFTDNGKKGEDIETLRGDLRRMMGGDVGLNIEEIRKPEIDAQLISDSIAQQLEKRIMFRRAMKRAMQNAMRLGAQGIKIMSSGRLNGVEIARREWYREGRVPLHTLRADIDYGFSEARTTYGFIGFMVWVFKGVVLAHNAEPACAPAPAPDAPKRPRRPGAGAGAGAKNVAAS